MFHVKQEILYTKLWVILFALAIATGALLAPQALGAPRKLRVVTSTTDLMALSKEVGGPLVSVESIAQGYQNPHSVDLKPSYMLKLSKADAFMVVGLDFDLVWAQQIIEGSRNPGIYRGAPGYVDVSRGVPLLESPHQKVSRAEGDIHVFGNPHYWLDPQNAKIIVRNIAEGLARVSPRDADAFRRNAARYSAEIDRQMKGWLEQMRPFRGAKIVAYHNSWPYFARRFGLRVVDFVEPKPGIAPSPAHIAKLIDLMKREQVKVIIKEPYFSERVPKMVASKTGAQVVTLAPSVGGERGADTYIELIQHNLDKLTRALR